jgi:Tfp pilus assembly protein FimV
MNPAPTKTQTDHRLATHPTSVRLSNPALDQIQSALAQQDRELDAAYSSIAGLVDVQFAIRSELLEEIDVACTTSPASRGALHTLTRC